MNWTQQVAHVFWKDLKRHKWLFIVLVLLTAASTWMATFGGHGEAFWRFPFVRSLLSPRGATMFLSLLIVGLLIQADSPSRSDAFWASKPLSPTAVFAAKVFAITLFLVVVPLLGHLAALVDHGVSGRRIPLLAMSSALRYAPVVALAAFAAVATTDLKSYILLLSGTLIASLLVVSSLQSAGVFGLWPQTFGEVHLRAAVAAVGAWGVVVYHYARRARWRIWTYPVAGFALGALAVSSGIGAPASGSLDDPDGRTPLIAPESALNASSLLVDSVYVRPYAADGSTSVLFAMVRLEDADPRFEYLLHLSDRQVRDSDGPIGRVVNTNYQIAVQRRPPLIPAYTPLAPSHPWNSGAVAISLGAFTNAELRRIAEGPVSLDLEGQLALRAWQPLGTLALQEGERVADLDRWFEVSRVTREAEGISLWGRGEEIGIWNTSSPLQALFGVALVNEKRREYVELDGRGGSFSTHPLVLPGATARTASVALQNRGPFKLPNGQPDAGWFDDAHLVVFDSRKSLGHPIRWTVDNLQLRPSRVAGDL